MVKHIKRETIEESSDTHQLLPFFEIGASFKGKNFFPGGTGPDFWYNFRRELEKVSMGHGCPRLLFLFHLQLNIGYTISEQDTIYILQTELVEPKND